MSFARVFFPLWLLVMATYCEARQYEMAQHVSLCWSQQ